MKRHIVPPNLKYKKLPKYIETEILKLYEASQDEFGESTLDRKRNFTKMIKLYWPYLNQVELESAYSIICPKEQFRYQSSLLKSLHGAYANKIIALFGKMDDDGNGVVSIDEFKKAFLIAGLPETQVQKCFQDADKNGDGILDLEELFNFILKNDVIYNKLKIVVEKAEVRDNIRKYETKRIIFGKLPEVTDNHFMTAISRRPSLADVSSLDERIEAVRRSHFLI